MKQTHSLPLHFSTNPAVKLLMIDMIVAHESENDVSGTADGVRETIYNISDAMRSYFLPARFYSRYYPYINFRSAMVRGG